MLHKQQVLAQLKKSAVTKAVNEIIGENNIDYNGMDYYVPRIDDILKLNRIQLLVNSQKDNDKFDIIENQGAHRGLKPYQIIKRDDKTETSNYYTLQEACKAASTIKLYNELEEETDEYKKLYFDELLAKTFEACEED